MNSSTQAKKQLCAEQIKSGCHLPLLSGIVHTCGTLSRSGGNTELTIVSSNRDLHSLTEHLMKKLFGLGGESGALVISGKQTKLTRNVFGVLSELKIISISDEGIAFVEGIDSSLVHRDKFLRAYLRGVFLGCGSLSVASSWHLEFAVGAQDYAEALTELLVSQGFSARNFRRKERYVVYLKKNEEICDFMAMIGATRVSLELSGKVIVNKTKSDTQRNLNLMFSNMDKTIDAGVRQAADIRKIARETGLDTLPEKLRQVAVIRLEDESLSYDDIAAQLGISKGSVRYRFRKIAELAGGIKGEK